MSLCKSKVAVIIPVYNVESYLSECLYSCITQSLYDIEIICVNDGSTDNSVNILEYYAQKDHRIKIINQENRGLPGARNTGLRAANSEVIMFLDSDDYLSSNACERVWCETKEAPTDIIVFSTDIFPRIPKTSNWMRNNLTHIRTKRYNQFNPYILFNEKGAKPFVWRQAYAASFLNEFNLEFAEEIKFGEDMVFQMEAFPHATHFAFISDVLYHYRWYREGSLMASVGADIDIKLQKHMMMCKHICEYWKQMGWFGKYGQDFTEWLLEFIIPETRTGELNNPNRIRKQLYTLIQEYNLEKYLRTVRPRLRSNVHTLYKAR